MGRNELNLNHLDDQTIRNGYVSGVGLTAFATIGGAGVVAAGGPGHKYSDLDARAATLNTTLSESRTAGAKFIDEILQQDFTNTQRVAREFWKLPEPTRTEY